LSTSIARVLARAVLGLALLSALGGCLESKTSTSATAAGSTGASGSVGGTIDRVAFATVSWDPPTRRVDGTPVGTLSGFRIYFGQQADALASTVNVTDPTTRSANVYNLGRGTWYFTVTAVDADGVESAPSAMASKTIT
jgi:hypothetical protein